MEFPAVLRAFLSKQRLPGPRKGFWVTSLEACPPKRPRPFTDYRVRILSRTLSGLFLVGGFLTKLVDRERGQESQDPRRKVPKRAKRRHRCPHRAIWATQFLTPQSKLQKNGFHAAFSCRKMLFPKENALSCRNCNFPGCGFFAYSWKLPAYSGAFLLTVDIFSSFTYNWSFSAYNFSFSAYSFSFSAYSGKVLLRRALRDCKQRSLTVSKKAPTVSKKASPNFPGAHGRKLREGFRAQGLRMLVQLVNFHKTRAALKNTTGRKDIIICL